MSDRDSHPPSSSDPGYSLRIPDFKDYTAQLRAPEIVWTDETLDSFLRDPDKLVSRTLMSVMGRIDSAKDRKDLIT